jgi:hypothetical protein
METLKFLLTHAVGQFGRDRTYKIRFGASTPIVDVFEDDTRLAEFWTVNDVIHEKKFY